MLAFQGLRLGSIRVWALGSEISEGRGGGGPHWLVWVLAFWCLGVSGFGTGEFGVLGPEVERRNAPCLAWSFIQGPKIPYHKSAISFTTKS